MFLAGERCDPSTLEWAQQQVKVPVIDNYWQTETGWPMCINPRKDGFTLPVKPGSAGVAVPGWDLRVLGADSQPLPAGQVDRRCYRCGVTGAQMGDVVATLPLPPGAATTLWNNDARYVKAYLSQHKGFYATADAGFMVGPETVSVPAPRAAQDEDGYLYVMSRTDDVINVAGHRLSTGEMEEIVARHADVCETRAPGCGSMWCRWSTPSRATCPCASSC